MPPQGNVIVLWSKVLGETNKVYSVTLKKALYMQERRTEAFIALEQSHVHDHTHSCEWKVHREGYSIKVKGHRHKQTGV